MIVTCPSCTTRFTVDASVLGAHGRRVRCVRCGHVWFQEPELDRRPEPASAEAPEAFEPPSEPPEWALPETEPEPRRRSAGGWPAFAAVVVLLAGGLLVAQEQIVGAWPAAGRLYEMLGMAPPAPGEGLEIGDVRPEARLEDGDRSVVVTGRVVNRSESAADVPPVRIMLVDENGQILSVLTTSVGLTRLESGEEAGFAGEFSEPAGGAARIAVAFDDPVRDWQDMLQSISAPR